MLTRFIRWYASILPIVTISICFPVFPLIHSTIILHRTWLGVHTASHAVIEDLQKKWRPLNGHFIPYQTRVKGYPPFLSGGLRVSLVGTRNINTPVAASFMSVIHCNYTFISYKYFCLSSMHLFYMFIFISVLFFLNMFMLTYKIILSSHPVRPAHFVKA